MILTAKELEIKRSGAIKPPAIIQETKENENGPVEITVFILHIPEWIEGEKKNYDFDLNGRALKVIDNIVEIDNEADKNDLIRRGFLLLKESKKWQRKKT